MQERSVEFTKLNPTKAVVFNPPTTSPKTVLLMGMGRSGTSMLAAVIDALGVPMGSNGIDGHYERDEFKWDFDTEGRWEKTVAEMGRLDSEYEMWGSKIRLESSWTGTIIEAAVRPCLIIVFRDLAAILGRHISYPDHRTTEQTMEWMIKQQQTLWGVASTTEHPVLLVSAEKLRYDSAKTIKHIQSFLLLKGSRKEALSRISKRGGYILENV